MPLTADDVVQKRFNPTKFREGYDQDEVDDFLDEVVAELRRLNEENEDLRRQLAQYEGRVSELPRSGEQTPAPAPVSAPVEAAPPVTPAPVASPVAASPQGTSPGCWPWPSACTTSTCATARWSATA
jgi:DivIVA domain-containing protein